MVDQLFVRSDALARYLSAPLERRRRIDAVPAKPLIGIM